MKIYCIYFSPTGGTKKILKSMAAAWNCEKIEIDLNKQEVALADIHFESEDICLVAVPSFSGRVPQFIIPKLKQLKGNGIKAILIASYGNRAFEDTLLELKDTMNSAGFINIAAVAAIAEHSIMGEYGTGRPNAEDIKQLSEFGVRCKEAGECSSVEISIAGNRPYRAYTPVPLIPKAGSRCNGCGLCVKECVMGAIVKEKPKNTDKMKCIVCMHCVAICPKKARSVNGFIKKVGSLKMKKQCSIAKSNQLFI